MTMSRATIVGEFSVLSPSQKKELERKRREQEAREAKEAARRAENTRKAKEAAMYKEAERIAALKEKVAEQEVKGNRLKFHIGVLCVCFVIVVWAWIHYFNPFCAAVDPTANLLGKIIWGVIYFFLTGMIAIPLLFWIGSRIKDTHRNLKTTQKSYLCEQYKSEIETYEKKIN